MNVGWNKNRLKAVGDEKLFAPGESSFSDIHHSETAFHSPRGQTRWKRKVDQNLVNEA